jgi:hypothetical protein
MTTCAAFDLVAPELAAGTLAGEERASALAHAELCDRCAHELAELAATADRLLLAVPSSEPPVGFESRVVTAVTAQHRARSRWVRPLAAAAAVLVIGGGVLALRNPGLAAETRTAAMRADDGRRVGYAVARRGDPGRVLVAIRGLDNDSEDYRVIVYLRSGRSASVGVFRLDAGSGVTEVAAPAPVKDLARIELVNADGNHECTGTFAAT